jgi:hypothetical protein
MVKQLIIPLAALLLAYPVAGEDKKNPFEEFQKLPKEAKAILEGAEKIELYSLDPADGKLPKDADGFHGWKVLGKTEIKDADTRKKVRAAINKGIADSSGVAGCFKPRHAIRATTKDKTVDLIICFECMWMEVHAKDKKHAIWTTGSPQKTLDKVLSDAKVPLPKQKDD